MKNIHKSDKFGLYMIIVICASISVFIESFAPETFQYFHQQFDIDSGTFASLSSLYFVIAAIMQVPGGMSIDVVGLRKIVPASMIGTIIGFILYWFALNNTMIAVGNIIWGLSLSISYLIALYAAASLFSPEKLPILIAILEVFTTIGNLSAYAPLEYLINQIGWNVTGIIIIAILVILLILFMVFFYRASSDLPQKKNFSFAIEIKNILQLIKNKYVIIIFMYSFSTWLIMIAFAGYWLKFYLITFNAMSNNKSLGVIELFWISFMLGTVVIGYLNKTMKAAKISLIILSFIGFICYSLFMAPNGFSSTKLIILIIFAGFSASGIILSNFILTQVVNKQLHGLVLSLNSAICLVGAYIGQNLFSFILLDTDLDYYFKILRKARMVSDIYPSLSVFLFFALMAWIASMIFFNQYQEKSIKV
jgi:predicted MFS family arabinose efflux permease